MKIAVYAICKNEEQFAQRFCDSASDADLIVVGDTGSTDNTAPLLRELGATVYDICITPWRFDKARDAVLALLPKDIDVCISLDLDEMLEPGWRQEIERLWVPGETTRLQYKFDWGHGVVFYANKVHARHGYHWHHPCHEYIRADRRITEKYAVSQMLMVTHHPDETKSRGQYMDLLKMSVEEDPSCPRNAFYYARELTYYRRWDEAVVELQRYLNMPQAVWDVERAYAMRLMGDSYEAMGSSEAIKWYRKGCAEAPQMREPWIALADACYRRGMWEECLGAALCALRITERPYTYSSREESWGSKPHDLAAIAAFRLGMMDEARKHGQRAVELEPENERLIKNMEYYNGST